MAKPPPLRAARAAEKRYTRQLERIARQIGEFARAAASSPTPARLSRVASALRSYREALAPWAQTAGERMLAEVSASNLREWRGRTELMGRSIREEIESAPTGEVMRLGLQRQVDLITSLPIRAAERVQQLATAALSNSERPAAIVERIMEQGDVTAAQARTIARTEVGRAQTELDRARAESIGSEGYIWRTAQDVDVRDSHRKMNGKFVRWDSPPTLDGMVGHAGQLPNCRCYAEPVIPE